MDLEDMEKEHEKKEAERIERTRPAGPTYGRPPLNYDSPSPTAEIGFDEWEMYMQYGGAGYRPHLRDFYGF